MRWIGSSHADEKAANEWFAGIEPAFSPVPALSEDANPTLRAALALWKALDANSARGEALTNKAARLAAYRAAAGSNGAPEMLAQWRRKLGACLPEDEAEWNAWQKQAQTTRSAKE